jgi:lipopolysaccharide transport system ATP-binding protein
MSDIAIQVQNLSKRYRIGLKEEIHDSLVSAALDFIIQPVRNFMRLRRLSHFGDNNQQSDTIWALKDVNFEFERGKVFGVIGSNGAGKSTLLKILARITEPTTGRVDIYGRISSLLEVGTGFHPELTGRENVYLNGTILGMNKAEVKRKFDQIVDFSGVEKFIDTPVKRYSSGMTVRLAFSVAAHLEPEILLVDEVLAVGDASFQKKCLGKMGDVVQEGRTVLFVSHNMAAVRQLCPTCLWIDNGTIKQFGASMEVVEAYLKDSNPADANRIQTFFEDDPNKDFQLASIRMIGHNGIPTNNFDCDKPIQFELTCRVRKKIPGLYAYMVFFKLDGTSVLQADSADKGDNILDDLEEGNHRMTVTVPARTIGPGDYTVYLSFSSKFGIKDRNVDIPGKVCTFHLDDFTTKRGNKRTGFLSTLPKWELAS